MSGRRKEKEQVETVRKSEVVGGSRQESRHRLSCLGSSCSFLLKFITGGKSSNTSSLFASHDTRDSLSQSWRSRLGMMCRKGAYNLLTHLRNRISSVALSSKLREREGLQQKIFPILSSCMFHLNPPVAYKILLLLVRPCPGIPHLDEIPGNKKGKSKEEEENMDHLVCCTM